VVFIYAKHTMSESVTGKFQKQSLATSLIQTHFYFYSTKENGPFLKLLVTAFSPMLLLVYDSHYLTLIVAFPTHLGNTVSTCLEILPTGLIVEPIWQNMRSHVVTSYILIST
jgi:hypothetical protein